MVLVVSNLARSFAELRAQALAQVPLADAIELRLDGCGDPGEAALRELCAALKKPVIVAVNGPEAFGHFTGTRTERFEILRAAARAGAAFVDVDWRESRALGAIPAQCTRIVSRHEIERTPADLTPLLRELETAAFPGDRLKLVTQARCAEDGLRVLELLRASTLDLVAFASGEKGNFTRTLAPIYGSPFTFAAPVSGAATAPGQLRADELRATWPASGVSSSTQIFAVVGNPARHSLSPRVHGAALRALAIDAVYVAIEPDDLDAFLDLCRAPNWRGFAVTAPFKEAAFARARDADESATRCRAANTLARNADGSWSAANTDALAVESVLNQSLPRGLAGAHVLVAGTGGSARAAIIGARSGKAAHVTVAGRDAKKSAALARELECATCALGEIGSIAYDALVHCTPLGSRAAPGEMPIDARALRRGAVVLDAVYRPARTPLLEAAARAGAIPVSGVEWFAEQAIAQFALLTLCRGHESALRAELARALEEDVAR